MRFASFPSFRSALTSALTLAAVGALSFGLAPSGHAAIPISVFTDQALFEATFPNLATGSFLNTFTGPIQNYTNYTATGNGFSYVATETGAFPQTTVGIRNLLQNAEGGASLIFTSTSGNFNAIGGNFFISDVGGGFVSGPITVTVSNGTDTVTQTYSPTSATVGSFRGFVSTLPITTLTISETTASALNSADNLRVGTTVASVNTAAPEPGSLALLLPVVGLAGMVIRRSKRRKK